MSRKKRVRKRRGYSDELKEEAVQMLLDGHSAESVVSNLGLSGTSLVYRWKAKFLQASGPMSSKSAFVSLSTTVVFSTLRSA